MKLRPHHLLCTQGYEGKGYSEDFVENMDAITSHLRNSRDAMVEIVLSTDDICNKCPLMIGEDLCETNEKVKTMDRKIVNYFGIEEKNYIYNQIINKINTNMTTTIMDDICGDCGWYATSACKQNILGGVC
ncbi:MAG: DUF1284 domain-containing protein [Defluviitaleaceae bacterium]|nr:DUF1284 domain-containing protein [Defluviitaleaceae bacterium]